MKTSFGLCLLFLLSACNAARQRQKDKISLASHTTQSAKIDQRLQLDSYRIYNNLDTGQTTFFWKIYPKGSFTFTTDSGFKGEAWQLESYGRVQKRQQQTAVANTQLSVSTTQATQNTADLKIAQTAVQTQTEHQASWLAWLPVLLVISVSSWIFRKRFFLKS